VSKLNRLSEIDLHVSRLSRLSESRLNRLSEIELLVSKLSRLHENKPHQNKLSRLGEKNSDFWSSKLLQSNSDLLSRNDSGLQSKTSFLKNELLKLRKSSLRIVRSVQ